MREHIWANHAHVFPENTKKGGEIYCLKALMAECHIEKAVCFACFQSQYEKGDPIKWLYDEIKNDSSLIGFGTIDFEKDDVEYQCEKITAAGFKGIKIHPAYQEINIMSEKARRVYAYAQKNKLFLSFHTGIHWSRLSDYRIALFDEVAWRYPELKFSMEHMGGYHFFREALGVMCNNSRNSEEDTVFAGWTSIAQDADGVPGAWSLNDTELKAIIKQTGNTRSIFGIDFPYNKAEDVNAAIERIEKLNIPEEAKEGILGKNLRRALGCEN